MSDTSFETKPVSEFTADERPQLIGMWVEVTPPVSSSNRTPFLGVLASLDAHALWGKGGNVDRSGHVASWYFTDMTLRPDLRRAWMPDGSPIPA